MLKRKLADSCLVTDDDANDTHDTPTSTSVEHSGSDSPEKTQHAPEVKRQKPLPAENDSEAAETPTGEPSRISSNLEWPQSISNGDAENGGQNGASPSSSSSKGWGSEGKRVRWDGVTAFYFQRSQGFSCVPSAGGTTLGRLLFPLLILRVNLPGFSGMTHNHHTVRRLSLTEHEKEVKQKRISRSSSDNSIDGCDVVDPVDGEDEEEVEEEEEEEETESAGEEDSDGQAQYFPQPLLTRERRALLKSCGVDVIEKTEREDCEAIRESRQTCGCECVGGLCDPDTCQCAVNGIRCQVDRPSFPCGCTAQSCHNPSGRIEFDPVRVRTHYIHTMMRLRVQSPPGLTSIQHVRFPEDENGGGGHHDDDREEIPSMQALLPTVTHHHSTVSPAQPAYLYNGGSYWHYDAQQQFSSMPAAPHQTLRSNQHSPRQFLGPNHHDLSANHSDGIEFGATCDGPKIGANPSVGGFETGANQDFPSDTSSLVSSQLPYYSHHHLHPSSETAHDFGAKFESETPLKNGADASANASTDSGYDEGTTSSPNDSSEGSNSTPVPLSSLYTHQRAVVSGCVPTGESSNFDAGV